MPRVVDKQERRSALIEAAALVFTEHGYHGATMQQVADRAGVSKGGLYEYFQSKDALLVGTAETIIESMFEEILVRLERSRGSLRQRVEQHARHILSQMPQWAELSRSMRQVWAELGDPADPLGRLLSQMYSRCADRIQHIFDDAVAAGAVPSFATRPAALMLMAAADGVLIQAVIAPEEFDAHRRSGAFERWCAALIPGPEAETADEP
jgi:AcrR family transcriptional regulator